MMMPANYSAIAENEMTYVVGGGAIEWLGSFTAPIFTTKNLKTLNTNLVTIIGNTYVESMIKNTLGLVFQGYTQDVKKTDVLANNIFATTYNQFKSGNVGDGIASVLGTAAALYNLGQGATKNVVTNNALKTL